MTEELNKGCEFQNDCIEYKDISYLKIMPICAIHELSIACHDKVNKCKYYKLYKELQRLKAENDGLKSQLDFEIQKRETVEAENEKLNRLTGIYSFRQMKRYKQALEEIREIANEPCIDDEDCETCDENCMSKDIINKINEVLKDE